MRRVALVGMAGEGYRKPAFGLRQQQQEDYSSSHAALLMEPCITCLWVP